VCLIAGVYLSFHVYGTEKGTWIFVATTIGVVVTMMVAWKILPRTAVGRKLLLSEKVEFGPLERAAEQERQSLIGRTGTAETPLRPAGRGEIDGRRWDVVSDGSYIEAGESFRVVRVEGPRIVVTGVPKETLG